MTRAYEVRISRNARRDLEEIYDFIALNDSTARANKMLDRVLTAVDSLEHFPRTRRPFQRSC